MTNEEEDNLTPDEIVHGNIKSQSSEVLHDAVSRLFYREHAVSSRGMQRCWMDLPKDEGWKQEDGYWNHMNDQAELEHCFQDVAYGVRGHCIP